MVGTLALLFTFVSSACAQSWMERPRLAQADLDGDGTVEIIAGGRIGRFLPVDTPLFARTARVEVFGGEGALRTPIASSPNLYVVSDVAAGDVDGDGVAEVVAVGAGRLVVLRLQGASLVIEQSVDVGAPQSPRVAMDGSVVAVAAYRVAPDGDAGNTEIRLYETGVGRLKLSGRIDVDAHVGDLAVGETPDGHRLLLAETGTAEEGGHASTWDVTSPASPVFVWSGPVTAGTRALTVVPLAAQDGPSFLFVALDGSATRCQWRPDGLFVVARSPLGRVDDFLGLSGVQGMAAFKRGTLDVVDLPR